MFEKDNLIIKIYGSDRFIAVREAFAIGKVQIEFRIYDKAKTQGDKIKQSIDIYMNMGKFTVLCELLRSGRMFDMLKDGEHEATMSVVNDLIRDTNADVSKMLEYYKENSLENMSDKKLSQLKAQLLKKLANQGGNVKAYENRKVQPVFEDFGGRKADNGVTSRVLNILPGSKYPVLFKASEGPGREGNNGQYVPLYKNWNGGNSKSVQIPLSAESAIEMGIAGLRAIAIYDAWVAMGTAEQNLDRLDPPKDGDFPGRQTTGSGRQGNGSYSERTVNNMYGANDRGQMQSARQPYADSGAQYREMRPVTGKQFGDREVVW